MSIPAPTILPLTGLRFVAAFSIVINHLYPVIFKIGDQASIIATMPRLAEFGMTLFFVMSGFIIHHNYAGSVSSAFGLWSFFVARFSRLYPLFIAVVALDIIFGGFFLFASPAERQPMIDAIPYFLTMTQSWFFAHVGKYPLAFPYHFSHVTWSISTEMALYFAYPLIAMALFRVNSPRRSAVVAVAALILATATLAVMRHKMPAIEALAWRIGFVDNPSSVPRITFGNWLMYLSPYARVFEFLVGCGIAHLYRRCGPECISTRAATMIAAVCLIAVAWYVIAPSRAMLAIGALPAISGLVLCAAFAPRNIFATTLEHPMLIKLGDASYSIYLIHVIVIEKLAPTAIVPDTAFNWAILSMRAILIVLAIFAVSLAVYRLYEVPARKWVRGRLMAEQRYQQAS